MMDLLDEGTDLEEAKQRFLESNDSIIVNAISELLYAFHNHHSVEELVDGLKSYGEERLTELANRFARNASDVQSMIDQMGQKLASIYPIHAFVCDIDDRVSIVDARSCKKDIQKSKVSYGTLTLPLFASDSDLDNDALL